MSKPRQSKIKFLIGIDEVGRGPIAGPVAVGAFCVPVKFQDELLKFFPKNQIRDSKKLKPLVREEIYERLSLAKKSGQIEFTVIFSSSKIIDTRGLSFAIKNALAQTLSIIGKKAHECQIFLDGSLKAPIEFVNQKTIIKGDEKEAVIALASIVAKVTRDRAMKVLAKKYPHYGFEIHKGYGTAMHYKNLKKRGMSPIHRRSFLKNFAG
ncbi:MAG: ribonuclease HII [Patescibacteria group bacterium]